MQSPQLQPRRDGFAELERLVETLPEDRLDEFREALALAKRQTNLFVRALQFSRREIAQLRLDATYLRFEAETNLRERDALARKLDR